jgi:hypothetical protein
MEQRQAITVPGNGEWPWQQAAAVAGRAQASSVLDFTVAFVVFPLFQEKKKVPTVRHDHPHRQHR